MHILRQCLACLCNSGGRHISSPSKGVGVRLRPSIEDSSIVPNIAVPFLIRNGEIKVT